MNTLILMAIFLCLDPGLSAAAIPVSIGEGSEVLLATSSFVGTYSGTTSSASSTGRMATIAFVDLGYGTVAIGYSLVTASSQPNATTIDSSHYAVALSDLSVGGILKLPIILGPVTLFPFIGLDYAINLMFVDDKENDLRAVVSPAGLLRYGGPWACPGVGVDLPAFEIYHFRLEVAYAIDVQQAGDPITAVGSQASMSLTPATQGLRVRLLSSWTIQ